MKRRIRPDPNNPRIQAALDELKTRILAIFPDATFDVSVGAIGDGSRRVYLHVTADAESVMDVLESCAERLVDMEVEEGLPVDVLPHLTPERMAQARAEWYAHYNGNGQMTNGAVAGSALGVLAPRA